MRNIAGLSQSKAQKSSDLFLKCRYMDEITGGKGIIFATGTPISNSMTELYTMQRYLQFNHLQENSLYHFDSWASVFGETTTAIELAPEGVSCERGYFSKSKNEGKFIYGDMKAVGKDGDVWLDKRINKVCRCINKWVSVQTSTVTAYPAVQSFSNGLLTIFYHIFFGLTINQ